MNDELWSLGRFDARSIPDWILFTRLAQTISWCTMLVRHPDFKPCLRSPQISLDLLGLTSEHVFNGIDGGPVFGSIDDIVCRFGNARGWLVKDSVPHALDSLPDLLGGRLMVLYPDTNLEDGAAKSESEGVFDESNMPPWDTWVSYFNDNPCGRGLYDAYLLAYVPAELLDHVDGGISVNPEECIEWLSDADIALRDRLLPISGL